MVRQLPQLLPQVLRAISSLREVNGSTVPSIVSEIRYSFSDSPNKPRNVAMQVRRALKHAIDYGMVRHRAGRYRIAKKKAPTDLAERTTDSSKRRSKRSKRSKTRRSRKDSEHDFRSKSQQQQRQQRRRHRRRQQNKNKRQLSAESKSAKSVCPSKSKSKSKPKSPSRNASSENRQEHQSRPTTAASAKSSVQGEKAASDQTDSMERDSSTGRRRRTRRRRHHPGPIPKNQPDVVPSVQDEPMDTDSSSPGVNNAPRNLSPRRRSIFGPPNQENEENNENEEESDHKSSYFN